MKKKILFFALALFFMIGCSEDRAEETSYPIVKEFIGNWKVLKIRDVSGEYINNTNTSLFVNVSASNISYKLTNGTFSGFGKVDKDSNAQQVHLSNGTVMTMFKTIQPDGTQKFLFVHSNSMVDEIMVKKE